MPIFPQVDMVPWGLNEMSVTYFDQNTTRIKQNSTLLILSKTLLLWLTSSLMHKFAFNPLGDWLMSDRSVLLSRHALHSLSQRTTNKYIICLGYKFNNNRIRFPQTEYLRTVFKMHLYDETFV